MTEVILHVYDVTNSGSEKTNNTILNINKIFKDAIGLGGIFHSAVQIHGDDEWSFGFCEQGTGVFSCPSTKNPMYTYRERIVLGKTSFSISKVNQILRELSREWPGNAYDLLAKNCNHFCDEFCERLGVSKLPGAVRVSVGPSAIGGPLKVNAILNGVEIMKMINPPGSQSGSKNRTVWIVVGSSIGGFAVLCLIIFVAAISCKCKKKKLKPGRVENEAWTPLRVNGGSAHSRMSELTLNEYRSLKIPFADIQMATNNFDNSLKIGSGGFGVVFKGVLRDNTKVAVKRGLPGSRQGLPEFQTEIKILSKIRHRHLVSLIGYCEEQSEMILVYEYMEKGPLKKHLYGPGCSHLSWKKRLEICIGAARGIHYLHTGSAQGIIHRDIKSTNILLDENYRCKVADFGLSRSGPCLDETHVSTGVKGSFGYLDPEYFRRQQLTDKSDVYSFGVVLFEVLCARPAVDPLLGRDQVNLAEWAMEWQKKGILEKIVDARLAGQIKRRSLKKFGETAEKCLADYGVDRPSMGDVLWNLESALQLQESDSEPSREPGEDSNANAPELPARAIAPQDLSDNTGNETDGGDGSSSSEIRNSQVFSQLMNNDGR